MKLVTIPATVFPFGKFKNASIGYAVKRDLRYCTWCLTLPAIARDYPRFVTNLRRAVAEAQLRTAEVEEAKRAATNTPSVHVHASVADLI